MRLIILGAGGFAREVIDLAVTVGHEVVACFQDVGSTPANREQTVTRTPIVYAIARGDCDGLLIAVGNPHTRQAMWERFSALGFAFPTLIHPSACISPYATIGEGCLVMQNTVVNADAIVRDSVIVNVATVVAHDCEVGPYVHLAPATQMGGGSKIGTLCETGTNATILPGVTVHDRTRVGAGAVVNRDVGPDATVVGVPARPVGAKRT